MPALIDLPGRQGRIADNYFDAAMELGLKVLSAICRTATKRLLIGQAAGRFFNDDELSKLIHVFAATMGTGDLLGRTRIRQQWTATLAAHGELPPLSESQIDRLNGVLHIWLAEDERQTTVEPMLPVDALAYFRNLVPSLGVDPMRWGFDLRRRVFTMAATTDAALLGRVQSLIAERMESGQFSARRTPAGSVIEAPPQAIADLLDSVGVTPRNPQYAEMVFRTNTIDAYNQAATQELQDPDVIETFPVQEYSNPDDERSRETHAERNGKFYPASVPFVQIRGTSIADAANCRCTFIPVSKWKWAELKAGGARIADGYPDVLSMTEMQAFRQRPAAVAG